MIRFRLPIYGLAILALMVVIACGSAEEPT